MLSDIQQLSTAHQSMLSSKYSTYAAWAQAQSDRLKSWGFNAAGQNSDRYGEPSNFPSGGVPVEQKQTVSGHAKRDDSSGGVQYYHCKSINYNYTGTSLRTWLCSVGRRNS